MKQLTFLSILICTLSFSACSSDHDDNDFNPVVGIWTDGWHTTDPSNYTIWTKDFKHASCDEYGRPLGEYSTYTIDKEFIYSSSGSKTKYEIKKNPEGLVKGTYLYLYSEAGTLILKKKE